MKRILALGILSLSSIACAQNLKLSVFDRLKEKASDASDVTLNKDLLKLAGSFLGSGDGSRIKKLADGLSNIMVRSLEFDKKNMYTSADVDALIAEMGAPGWTLIIKADERNGSDHEVSRIWVKSSENGELGGLRIMSAEARELSVIEIVGKVRLEDLKDLKGLGLPDVNINLGGDHNKTQKKNDE